MREQLTYIKEQFEESELRSLARGHYSDAIKVLQERPQSRLSSSRTSRGCACEPASRPNEGPDNQISSVKASV